MEKSALVYAYLGDAIYELYIREFLIEKGIVKVNELQKQSVSYVSAKAQAKFLRELINKDFFNDEELSIIKNARNHKSHSSKSTDILTYKHATALEAIIGYLYYQKDKKRIEQIINEIKLMEV